MRKKKIITAEFSDGTRELPSSIKIKCNATGQLKGFYTPYLIRLIKRKYDNNYQHFIDNYVAKGQKKIINNNDEEEENDLSLYKTVLQMEYTHLKCQPKTAQSQGRLGLIKDRFDNRFPDEDIGHYDT